MSGARALLAAVLVAAALAPATADAQRRRERRRDVIERVVAVVNDEAIFLSELRRRAVPFLEQAMSASTQVQRMAQLEALYNQLLDSLIDEELIQQAARKTQVRVTTSDVERAIENVRRQSGMSEPDFWGAVRQQGFTEAQYRSDVRRQLLRLKVLNNRVRGRVNITEDDVRARYLQMVREANQGSCFEVSMLVFPVEPDAGATAVADARNTALTMRRRLTPATFEDAGAVDLGRICQNELNRELEDAMRGMRVGQISQPVRTPNGFVLLHVRSRASNTDIPPYEELRQDLTRRMMEEAMASQERIFLEQLRREAVLERRL